MAEQNIWLSDFFPQVDQGILLGSILYDENAIRYWYVVYNDI